MDRENYERLGLDKRFTSQDEVNGRSNMEILDALAPAEDAQYNPCAEALAGKDVRTGLLQRIDNWSGTDIYAGTYRDLDLYLPAKAAPKQDLPIMVFNDGLMYSDPAGPVRAARVLDTLIHAGELPAIAAIFVMPGRLSEDSQQLDPTNPDQRDMDQRSLEYDSLTADYGQFLIEELLPFAATTLDVSFSNDPARRAICGISSGGICAFNTAWHHPHSFTRVLSHCGSFTNIRGGHNFPFLIRSTTRKPIRVFLTSGKKDADIILGNWPLANQQVAAALNFAGYDHRFEYGEGGHSLRHGGAIFGDSLRWLWRPDGDA